MEEHERSWEVQGTEKCGSAWSLEETRKEVRKRGCGPDHQRLCQRAEEEGNGTDTGYMPINGFFVKVFTFLSLVVTFQL